MRTRVAVSVLALLIAAGAGPVVAQQPEKVRRIGSLSPGAKPSERDEVIKQGLRELGWIDGQNVRIEYRWAGDRMDRLPALAEELVRLDVDVIIAWLTPAVQAAKNATQKIPIIIGQSADPVATGFVTSLSRPGGNITGVSRMAPDLAAKRLEILREIRPGLSRVAFLARGDDPGHVLFVKEAVVAGERLGIHVQPVVVKGPDEFDSAFAAMVKARVEALIVQPIFVTTGGHGPRIAELAARHRLPSISDGIQFAELGGLLYYGPDSLALWRHVAVYVDRILRGAKPADLPVMQPQKFEIILNLRTAEKIGVAIPQAVLLRADKVID